MKGRLERAERDPVYERFREAFTCARTGDAPGPRVFYPSIAVYVGAGASHSWIWYADLLERIGLFDVTFIDESRILGGLLRSSHVLLIGGGDTYAMAGSLGASGAAELERFVRGGGLYYGSCAGAYLVLSGVDIEPFKPFELVAGDMLNVMCEPPAPRCLEHKYLAAYGEQSVFHAVYGEVMLGPGRDIGGYDCFRGRDTISAPLFGGPVISAGDGTGVLACFRGLTGRAAFLWPRPEAERLLLGKDAVITTAIGNGDVVASGPHLEHPLYPQANALVAEVILRHCSVERATARPGVTPMRILPGRVAAGDFAKERSAVLGIKREVSNSRIVAFGLERMPVTWKIGLKVWEPEKLRMFLEVAWRRIPYLQHVAAKAPLAGLERLREGYGAVTVMLKSLRTRIESGEDSQAEASSLLNALKELTAGFLTLYFRLRLEEDA